uniref:Uncharacterized protein n=1 Tax=Aegilops tauschii subsp. strangulata TaxID=200361 RepID=A0A453J7L5_AEGTS
MKKEGQQHKIQVQPSLVYLFVCVLSYISDTEFANWKYVKATVKIKYVEENSSSEKI